MKEPTTPVVIATPRSDGGLTLTVELGPDPDGVLSGTSHSLGAYLAALTGSCADETALSEALQGLTYMARLSGARARHLALVARDQYGWTLRTIARALDVHHSTIQEWVSKRRTEMAAQGMWVDARGVHRPRPDDTLTRAERVRVAKAIAFWRADGVDRPGLWFEPPATLPAGGWCTVTARWGAPSALDAHEDDPIAEAYHGGPVTAESYSEILVGPEITLEGGPLAGEVLTLDTPSRERLAMEYRGAPTRAVYTPDPHDHARWIYQGEADENTTDGSARA